MKAPAVDKTAAYMNKGIKNNPAQNAPKGASFEETLTSKPGSAGLGMSQHKRPMNKTGTRSHAPHEHLNPSAAVFHKIGR